MATSRDRLNSRSTDIGCFVGHAVSTLPLETSATQHRVKRSPLGLDLWLTVLCGTSDTSSILNRLSTEKDMLAVILSFVLPEWRRQAEAIDLYAAAKHGRIRQLQMKLHLTDVDVNSQNDYGTAVHWAAGCERIDALRLLLQCGGDSNRANSSGETPLHWATRNKSTHALGLLLKYGGDPNTDTNLGWTAVHCAARYRHTNALELLLQHRGDPNRENQRDETAVHEAAQNGHAETLFLLLQHGGDTSRPNNQGWTPNKYNHMAIPLLLESCVNASDLRMAEDTTMNLSVRPASRLEHKTVPIVTEAGSGALESNGHHQAFAKRVACGIPVILEDAAPKRDSVEKEQAPAAFDSPEKVRARNTAQVIFDTREKEWCSRCNMM